MTLSVLALVAGRVASAAPIGVPLTSPAPGSPVFVSFRAAFDNNFTTQFQLTATGGDLAYVWSLQNVSCGSIASPQGRGPTNGYAHEGCPIAQEIPVRVTVLVARAVDLNADGTPKSDDVPRFVYSQIARAQDAPDTQNVPPAPSLQYFGPAPAIPTTTSRPAEGTAATTSGPVAGATEGAAFPWWIPVIALALAGLVLFGWLRQRTPEPSKDPCDEQRRRVARARVGVDEARARQRRITDLAAASDKAQADLARAQRESQAAHDPNATSWGEDVETGRRVYTNKDQVARMQAADAALKAATDAAAAARSAYDGAGDGGEIQRAQYAVEDAQRELGRAEEALARCLQQNPPPPPSPVSPPPQPPPPPSTGGGTTPPPTPPGPPVSVSTPPPTPPTRERRPRRECEDGAEPRIEQSTDSFELYLLWAAKISIDGAFQFDEDDVQEALDGYKNFKTIVDIAQVFEGFAGAGGAHAVGEVDVEGVLSLFTSGVKRAADAADAINPIDPGDAAQKSVEDALNRLIERVNRLRGLGTWTMTCPRVRVDARCTRTYECRDGRWVLTKHEFKLEYGEQVGTGERSYDNLDQTNPERGAREARRRLTTYFNTLNRPAMERIKAMVQRCAAQ